MRNIVLASEVTRTSPSACMGIALNSRIEHKKTGPNRD